MKLPKIQVRDKIRNVQHNTINNNYLMYSQN